MDELRAQGYRHGETIVYDYLSLRRTTRNDRKVLTSVVAAKTAAAVMFNDTEAGNEIISASEEETAQAEPLWSLKSPGFSRPLVRQGIGQ